MTNLIMEIKRICKLLTGDMPLQNGALDTNYEQYWKNRENADKLITKREARIKQRMGRIAEEIEDNTTVLDIGCGTGDLLSVISKKNPNCRLFGIDISQEAVKRTRAKNFQADKIDITTTNFNDLEKFDYIVMSELIEHLANPEKVLLGLKDHANKKIIITTPNVAFILFRLRLFFWGKFPITTVFHIREHLSLWSVKDFLYWADFLGFKTSKKACFGGVALFKLNKRMPNLFANHMLYVLEAK